MITQFPGLPDGATDRITARLDAKIARRRVIRSRRRIALVGAAVVAVAGGSSIAGIVLASPTQQSRSTYCYSALDTGSAYTQVGIPDEAISPDGTRVDVPNPQDRIAEAIAMCGAVWRAEIFDTGSAPDESELIACVRPDNVPAVFPRPRGDDRHTAELCGAVGMTAADIRR